MDSRDVFTPHRHTPLDQLEQALIEQFIRMRGYDPAKLTELAPDALRALLKDASTYACGKLTEVESRSHYLDDLHDGSGGPPRPDHH